MTPTNNDNSRNPALLISGVTLILATFFMQAGIRSAMSNAATTVFGAHDFIVGEIQGDDRAAVARTVAVEIEPNTDYIMKVEVTGAPEIHMDLMSPDTHYDNAEQELAIPPGPKNPQYTLLFNSGNVPPSQILLRIHFQDARPISVKSVDLLRAPAWASWIGAGVTWLTFGIGLVCLLLAFISNHARVGILVFFASAFASYQVTKSPLDGDNRNYGMVAQSLLSDGDIILNEFSARIESNKLYGIVQSNGNLYNLFPLGPSIVLAPLQALVSVDPTLDASTVETRSGRLATALLFGSALFLFFLIASQRQGALQWNAVLLTFIYGFCSHQFSQHINMFWSHNAVMPFILGALLALRSERRNMVFLAGMLLVVGYVMRPTAALLVPVVVVWLWIYQRRSVGRFVAGCLVAGSVVASMNLAFYGHLISPYSQVGRLGIASFPEALMGNLFSPNRGLFIFMPWALVSMSGIWLAFRKEADPFYRLISGSFFLHLVLVSSFPHWWAGWSYGPRFLVEVMPMLVLLLLPALSSPFWLGRSPRFIFAAALLFSLLVQVGGLTGSAGAWNALPVSVDLQPSRIWDWRDLQLLRPLNPGGARTP